MATIEEIRARFEKIRKPVDPPAPEPLTSKDACARCKPYKSGSATANACPDCRGERNFTFEVPPAWMRQPFKERWPLGVPMALPVVSGKGELSSTPRVFLNRDDGRQAYYVVARYGRVVRSAWGKIGTKGQESYETFQSIDIARAEKRNIINRKIRKGYKEVTPK